MPFPLNVSMYVHIYLLWVFVNLLNILRVINVPNSAETQRDDTASYEVHVSQLFNYQVQLAMATITTNETTTFSINVRTSEIHRTILDYSLQ